MKRSDMDMIAQDMVCIAERADGKGKVEGYYFCLHHNDGRTHLHHLIIPLEADLSKGTPLDQIQVEVVPESITLKAQEPRIMTLEELEALKDGDVVWGEHCYKADGGFTPSTMAPMMRSVRQLVCGGCQLMIEERMFKHPRNWFDDHERFRFWTAKPSEKQREEVPWE